MKNLFLVAVMFLSTNSFAAPNSELELEKTSKAAPPTSADTPAEVKAAPQPEAAKPEVSKHKGCVIVARSPHAVGNPCAGKE